MLTGNCYDWLIKVHFHKLQMCFLLREYGSAVNNQGRKSMLVLVLPIIID